MEFMPHDAPLVILFFLGTCFGLGVTGILIVYGLARGRRALVKYSSVAALAAAGIYAALLLTTSLASEEKVLALGEQKYFCEVDCHEAYSVTGVTTARTLGTPPSEVTAAGTFYVVTAKVWFDERTISSRRARDLQLIPNPRAVSVVDARGRRYTTSPQGQAALARAGGKVIPLSRPLRPDESYTTDFVFDLPGDAEDPRLFIATADWVTRLLIGHENSLFHKKVFFGLAPQSSAAALARPE